MSKDRLYDTPHTLIVNDLEDIGGGPHNFKDGEISIHSWSCECGRDYATVFHGDYDNMDFHCVCGVYIKKFHRIPDEQHGESHYINFKKKQ